MTDWLREKLDDSTLPWLIIEGIRYRENKTNATVTKSVIDIIKSGLQLPDISANDIDKCHRIDPINNDGKQNIIIKFTKHRIVAIGL